MIPSVGRMVHYVLSHTDRNKGQHRPAVIVRVFDDKPTVDSAVNLQVFTDSANDSMQLTAWRTSVHQDPTGTALGSWHEMEKVEQPAAAAPSHLAPPPPITINPDAAAAKPLNVPGAEEAGIKVEPTPAAEVPAAEVPAAAPAAPAAEKPTEENTKPAATPAAAHS